MIAADLAKTAGFDAEGACTNPEASAAQVAARGAGFAANQMATLIPFVCSRSVS